ncbi:zinc-binding protein A33-like [Scyliorhinus canicula]|uniref:zinc-binding protein A33-like n=1 Tax=Scyliorhinus canicula TaxID=7830 RepID=UPI0018F2FEE3|nr:zinc-binding protein A33-like [Scyliorhinus canicula]
MAACEVALSLSEDLTCSVCLSLFVEPVRLVCDHNFCKSCIQKCWEKQSQAVSCPECRLVLLQGSFTSNRVLANLCEKARQLELKLEADWSLCEEHREKLILFCEEDEMLICASCVGSPPHSAHRYQPPEMAADIYKDHLKLSLDSMETEKKNQSELKQQQEWEISELEELTGSLGKDISAQFAKIHQYLEDKEKHLIKELRTQKEEDLRPMEENLRRIEDELASLEEKISNLSVDIKQQDCIAFLKELKRYRERYLDKEEKLEGAERDEDAEILMVPRQKYTGFRSPLLYTLWKGMKQIISPAPAPLTLDPNTAHCKIILSEDLTSVRCSDTELLLPDNAERFDTTVAVLGSQGFISGKQYWEVEVGDKTKWVVGVTKESVNRKGMIKMSPMHGCWTVWHSNGNDYGVMENQLVRLTLNLNPRIVGVFLDYEGGQVTFYNADDMSVLHTFTDTFTEKLFPFFYPGSCDKGKNVAPLKLRHFEV